MYERPDRDEDRSTRILELSRQDILAAVEAALPETRNAGR